MAITNLTNTKWQFNEHINLSSYTEQFDFFIDFKSIVYDGNESLFNGISLANDFMSYGSEEDGYEPVYGNNKWLYDSGTRKITITGGEDVTNSDLIAFLTANAVQVTAPSFTRTKAAIKIYEDLTQEEYNALTKEPHSFYLVNGVGIYKGTTLISAGANSSMDEIVEELNQAIAAKQDTLVSGTNIKTINGESILGAGNIEVAASDDGVDTAYVENEVLYIDDDTSAGGDGLTEDDVNNIISANETIVTLTNDVRDLQTDKQDALVSGTNIKTINNQSILGSGNITIEGGSGNWLQNQYKSFRYDNEDLVFDNFTEYGTYYNNLTAEVIERERTASIRINMRNVNNCKFLITVTPTQQTYGWQFRFLGETLGAINLMTTNECSLGDTVYGAAIGHSFYYDSINFSLNGEYDAITNDQYGFVLVTVVNGVLNVTIGNFGNEV